MSNPRKPTNNLTTLFSRIALLGAILIATGCRGPVAANERVVLYCSQDREYAEGILADFTKKTGIAVELRADTEADKSVSLYEALVRESGQPRCDVFWCNEPVLMQRLAQRGILQPYSSPSAEPFPSWTRPNDRTWQAFAARARILIVNNQLAEHETPKTLNALGDPKWHKRFAMAKPFFGTTATHAACLWHKLGPAQANDLLTKLSQNAVVLPGNKDVAVAVAEGKLECGLTDTDDAVGMLQKGYPVRIVYLDQPQPGTLFLPNTLALIKGAPHADQGKKLIDFLLSAEVEERLAAGPSAQIPLNPGVQVKSLRIATPATIKAMEVDYAQVAQRWEEVQTTLRSLFR